MTTKLQKVVLVAVSDPDRRSAVTAALHSDGMLPISVKSLAEGRQLFAFQGLRVDAVFLDLQSPETTTFAAQEFSGNMEAAIIAVDRGVDPDACASWTLTAPSTRLETIVWLVNRRLSGGVVHILALHRRRLEAPLVR